MTSSVLPAEVNAVTSTVKLETIFSRKERARFINKAARLLFVLEYLVLIEYVEVVLPIVYSLHRVILFHLHNRAYYPSLAHISSSKLVASTLSVLGYGALEFASLVMTLVTLKRVLGFSSLSQLTFVLEKQANKVQSKLTILFVYLMEVSLVHLGSDLSFNFAWIKSRQ
ncbi:hypothetical protein PF010_g16098 [Phytophthora fragariae]|nr:hypothetical protein PF010_g16098 [Phytophthora fragariae]